jgi:hypothetical protein
MSQQALKELLKPPYANIEGDIIGNENISISFNVDNNEEHIFHSIADFIEKALVEKWERDFGEHKNQ